MTRSTSPRSALVEPKPDPPMAVPPTGRHLLEQRTARGSARASSARGRPEPRGDAAVRGCLYRFDHAGIPKRPACAQASRSRTTAEATGEIRGGARGREHEAERVPCGGAASGEVVGLHAPGNGTREGRASARGAGRQGPTKDLPRKGAERSREVTTYALGVSADGSEPSRRDRRRRSQDLGPNRRPTEPVSRRNLRRAIRVARWPTQHPTSRLPIQGAPIRSGASGEREPASRRRAPRAATNGAWSQCWTDREHLPRMW